MYADVLQLRWSCMIVVVNIYMGGFQMHLIHEPLAKKASSSYCTVPITFQLFYQGDHYFLEIVVCIAHRFHPKENTHQPSAVHYLPHSDVSLSLLGAAWFADSVAADPWPRQWWLVPFFICFFHGGPYNLTHISLYIYTPAKTNFSPKKGPISKGK